MAAITPEPRRAGSAELGTSDRERFQLELEFVQCVEEGASVCCCRAAVQCLANPQYLNWLAQNRFFEDPCFLNFLTYLQYWKEPQYAKFVIYPHALYFLELLQSPEFRTAIANPAYKEHVHTQQFFFWQHYKQNRAKEPAGQQQQQQQQQRGATGAVGGQQEGGG